jgi:acyl-CoA hydrolase
MEGKNVKDSAVTISYLMLPEDANPAGNVHGGIIMKHIDMTGGVAAMRHARCNVVTASIDSLIFHYPVFVGDLVTLKASLNLVARSSMEIGVRVETENLYTGEKRHTASAYLTFVALDRNGRPTQVSPLILETEEEQRRNRQAIARREIRLAAKKRESAEIDK